METTVKAAKGLFLVATFASVLAMSGIAMAQPAVGPANLVLHLDAQDNSTVLNGAFLPASNGEVVPLWVDKAGGDQNATPTLGGGPTYNTTGGPLGQPVLDFNGSNNLVSGSVPARTVSIVHRWDSAGSPRYLMDFRSGGIPNSWMHSSGLGSNWDYYVNDSLITGPEGGSEVGQMMNDTWQITTFTGADVVNSGLMHIMSRFSNNEGGVGAIGEILVYDGVLNQTDRLAVVDYLDQNWFNPIQPSVVPEPSTFLLGVFALLGLAACNWRRRRLFRREG